jgi:hypothetical protein
MSASAHKSTFRRNALAKPLTSLPRVASAFLLAAFLWVFSGLALAQDQSNIVITGNEALPQDTLFEIMDIPPDMRITESLAQFARDELHAYYHMRGYTLARIWTTVFQGRMYITIDEGKLEKIIVRGDAGGATSIMIRWLVELPYDVYNEPLLKTQLDIIRNRFGLSEISTEIWKSPRIKQVGFQLSDLNRKIFTREVATWELHIVIAPSRGSGPSLGAMSSPYYGLVPFAQYTRRGPFFENREDVLQLKLESGFDVRRDLNNSGYMLRFTHVQLGGRYDFPPLAGLVRFYTDSHVETSSFQRADLPLDEYRRFILHNSLNLGLDLKRGLVLSMGGGIDYTSLFGVKQVAGSPFPVATFSRPRYFVTAELDLNLTPDEVRIDRLQKLTLNYSFYQLSISRWHRLQAYYRQVVPFGYNDFIFSAKGLYTFGATPFYDEASLGGRQMRSFFKNRYFVDRAAWLSADVRFSLWKDIIKIGLYHDLALFGQLRHSSEALARGEYREEDETEEYALANSFGPSFHWLIYDTFQFDLYGTIGFAPHGYNIGYFFEFKKVFW